MTDDEKLALYYVTNEEKLHNAGKRAMRYCEGCVGCKYYEDVGMTHADLVEPIIHGICHHKELQDKANCKGREELT